MVSHFGSWKTDQKVKESKAIGNLDGYQIGLML